MARKPIDGYWLKIGSKSKEELSIKINKEPKPKLPPLEKYYLKIGSNSAEELSMIVSKDSLPRPPKKNQPELSGTSIQGRPIRRTISSCNTDLLMARTKPRKYQRSKTTEQCSIEVVQNENVELVRPFISIRDRISSDSNYTSSPELTYQPQGSGQSLNESIPSTSSEISESWLKSSFTPSLHLERSKEIENTPSIRQSCIEDTIYENSRLVESNSPRDSDSHLYENNLIGNNTLPGSCASSSENHYENIPVVRPTPRKRISLESNNEPSNNIVRDISQNNSSTDNSDSVRTFSDLNMEQEEPIITSNIENLNSDLPNSNRHLELRAFRNSDNNDQLTISETSEDIRPSREIVLLKEFSNNSNVNLNSQRSLVVSRNNSVSEILNNNERRSSVNSNNSSQRDRNSISYSDICLRRSLEGNNDDDTGSVNDSFRLNSNSFNDKHSISKSKRNKTVEHCRITVTNSSDNKKISTNISSPKINNAEQCTILVSSEDSGHNSTGENTNLQMIGPKRKVKETCFITESKSSKKLISLEQVNPKIDVHNGDLTDNSTVQKQQQLPEKSMVVRKNMYEENKDVHNISKSELTPAVNNCNSRICKDREKHLESVDLYSEEAGSSTNSMSKEINRPTQGQKQLGLTKGRSKTIENCSIIVAKHCSEPCISKSNPSQKLQFHKTSQEECSILVAHHLSSPPTEHKTESNKEITNQQKKSSRSQILEKCSIIVRKNAGNTITTNEINTSTNPRNCSAEYSLDHSDWEEIDQCFNSSQIEGSSSRSMLQGRYSNTPEWENNTNRIYPNLDSIEECNLVPLRNDLVTEPRNVCENSLITIAADVHRPIDRDSSIQNLTEISLGNENRGEQDENLNTRQREESEGAESRSESEQLTSPTENSKLASLAENESLAPEASANNVDGTQPAISVSATVILRQRSQSTSSQESNEDETQEDISTDESREDPPGQEAEPCIEETGNNPPTSPRRLRWYVVQVHENNNEGIPTIESPPPYDAIYRDEHHPCRPFQPPTYDEACRTSQR